MNQTGYGLTSGLESLDERDWEYWKENIRAGNLYINRAPRNVLQAASEAGACVMSVPVSAEGRLESLWYLHEQSISIDYHCYGNLGIRASETRANVF